MFANVIHILHTISCVSLRKTKRKETSFLQVYWEKYVTPSSKARIVVRIISLFPVFRYLHVYVSRFDFCDQAIFAKGIHKLRNFWQTEAVHKEIRCLNIYGRYLNWRIKMLLVKVSIEIIPRWRQQGHAQNQLPKLMEEKIFNASNSLVK